MWYYLPAGFDSKADWMIFRDNDQDNSVCSVASEADAALIVNAVNAFVARNGPQPRKVVVTDTPKRRLDPDEVAKALGAEPLPAFTVQRCSEYKQSRYDTEAKSESRLCLVPSVQVNYWRSAAMTAAIRNVFGVLYVGPCWAHFEHGWEHCLRMGAAATEDEAKKACTAVNEEFAKLLAANT